jgi:hypothetical protein
VHELAVHTHDDPLHVRPVPQVSHLAPPPPHAASLGMVTHRLSASQQPVGQVMALQPMTTSTVPVESEASRIASASCASTGPPSSVLEPPSSVEASGTSEDRGSVATSEDRVSDRSRDGASDCESIGTASTVLVSMVPGASRLISTRMSAADWAESVGECRSANPSRCEPSKSEPLSATVGLHVAVSAHEGSSPHAVDRQTARLTRATRRSGRWQMLWGHAPLTGKPPLSKMLFIVSTSIGVCRGIGRQPLLS